MGTGVDHDCVRPGSLGNKWELGFRTLPWIWVGVTMSFLKRSGTWFFFHCSTSHVFSFWGWDRAQVSTSASLPSSHILQSLCGPYFFTGKCLLLSESNQPSLAIRDFLGGNSGKESPCQCRRHKTPGFDPWVGKISWRRAWQPTLVFLPGESYWQRNLEDYSP